MKKNKHKTAAPAPVVQPAAREAWERLSAREWKGLGLILLTGLILRILFLGRCSLWQDEMGFITLADPQATLGELARQSWGWILSIGQQPLGFMLQNIYMRLFSPFVDNIMFDPFWARLHWLLWGVAAVGGVFAMVRAVRGREAAMLSAFLFAVSFYPVFYSREVYPYAGVMAAAAFSAYFAYRHVFLSARPWKWALACAGSTLVLVYLHLNGVVFYVMLSAVIGLVWLKGYVGHRAAERPPWVRQATYLILCLLLVGLAVSPYVLRFVLLNKAHTQGSTFPLWMILQDPIAKYFLGERMPALVVAWLVVGGGVIAVLLGRGERATAGRMLAVTGLAAWLLIGWSTARSQYLSARYFAPVAPVMFWLFAEGLLATGRVVKGVKLARLIPLLLAGVYALIHLALYLPGLYALRDKDVGFGRIADWLNTNLQPGMPYLMESAYELRWVSGYHPTPGLIGAAPYLHGGAPGELDRLHQRQIDFMQRFPEAPFVESAHHNWNTPEGLWTWPHTYHAQRAQIRNDALRDLVRKGIFPGVPFEPVSDYSYVTDIYYSTWDDIEQRARERGDAVSFRYPGWTVVQVAQGEYRRAIAGSAGALELRALIDGPVSGRLVLGGMVFGERGGEVALSFMLPGRDPVRRRATVGQPWRMEIPVADLADRATLIDIQIASTQPVQGLVLDEVGFEHRHDSP